MNTTDSTGNVHTQGLRIPPARVNEQSMHGAGMQSAAGESNHQSRCLDQPMRRRILGWIVLGSLLGLPAQPVPAQHVPAQHVPAQPVPAQPVAAQPAVAESSIWADAVLSQPGDTAPFRPIAVPPWVEETVGVGYTLSVQTSEQRAKAVAAGVTISEMGFVDPFYVYYDSRLLSKRNPHVPPERLAQEIAEYRRLGVRILAVYPPTLQGEVYEKHPDWRRIATPGGEIPSVDLTQFPHGGMLCPLGPYGDFFIEVLAEIVEKFQVDAFSFDGLHYGGVCYCQHCRESYRQEAGQEIPAINMDDLAFRRYQHWADRRMERLVQRMQTRLKGLKPDVALITWTTNAGRFGHFLDIPRNMPARMNLLLDAPDQEFWLDETNRGNTIVPAFSNAYIWACTNHRVAFSEPYLMSHGNPYGKDSFPGHEIERRMLMTLTHGAAPSLAVIQPAPMQSAAYDALAAVQKRRPWLTHKQPERWAALLMSDNTRVFYGRSPGQVEDRYLAHVFGAFRVAMEEHLPVNVICDWNLNPRDLAQYQVLILPNAACLNDDQVAAVRGFVEQGGGLVASLDTSFCDEWGESRGKLALSDVLGVDHGGVWPTSPADPTSLDVNFARQLPADYWQKRQQAFLLKLPADSPLRSAELDQLIGTDPVTFKGPALRLALPSPAGDTATVAATLVPHHSPQAPPAPAIVTRPFGRGRVAYFGAALDHACYSYAYPYQRELWGNAIRWAAPTKPPVEISAPMCVQASVFRQTIPVAQPGANAATESSEPPAQRLLIHLFNNVNTTAFHAQAQVDVPLREEVLPIHNIRLKLSGYQLTQVTQQPEGKTLEPTSVEPGVLEIVVPELQVHSVIVCELSKN